MPADLPDSAPERGPQHVVEHVGLEVAELERSAVFYDAVFATLGVRRVHSGAGAIGYGKDLPAVWIVQRGRGPGPSFGHLAIAAAGRRAVDAAHAAGISGGGTDSGAPGPRPHYGRNYYAGYLQDPDGYRVEIVAGAR